MINIIRKENCTGCSACFDICPPKAIAFETDMEGFWYPVVNQELCIDCGLCEKTCPELHIKELKHESTTEQPVVLASCHNDDEIRRESTSGGLFSALAETMYDDGGYVGGSVYTEDFHAKHILSNKREDLLRIRGSKHFQSETAGMFVQIKALLNQGQKVLVCGAPCQMAGLRLFLGKDYENLIIVDFICLGINSPKIFQKHLQSLEKKYGAKVVSVQGKNKDLGWRSLAYKIRFANEKIYLRKGKDDPFTRGFVSMHINCRPVCYECKYKGFPRISDITLGDFWGIENVDKKMDDNFGTSVVLLNTQKGKDFFNSIKDRVRFSEKTLSDVLPGNRALLTPIAKPLINRDEFYADVDRFDFSDVVRKYFSQKESFFKRFRNKLEIFANLTSQMGISPKAYIQFLWVNFLRKKTQSNLLSVNLFFPARYAVLDIHKSARVSLRGVLLLGYKRIKGSRLETRLAVEKNGSLVVENGFASVYYGSDILVFRDAILTFKGKVTINQNVQIICMNSIRIGEDVMISRDVVIRDNDGGHEILSEGYKKTAPVIIGNHVWIGQGAMIMKGVTIGDGAIISSGAWVTTNVKPNALVMGDPARTIQKNVEWRH